MNRKSSCKNGNLIDGGGTVVLQGYGRIGRAHDKIVMVVPRRSRGPGLGGAAPGAGLGNQAGRGELLRYRG